MAPDSNGQRRSPINLRNRQHSREYRKTTSLPGRLALVRPAPGMLARAKRASHIDPPGVILRHHAEGVSLPRCDALAGLNEASGAGKRLEETRCRWALSFCRSPMQPIAFSRRSAWSTSLVRSVHSSTTDVMAKAIYRSAI
jgi:hypothetical protein